MKANASTPSGDANPHERNVTVQGFTKTPLHGPVAREILPAVGIPDIAGTGAREAAIAGEMKRVAIPPSLEIAVRAGTVVLPAAIEMGSQQHIERHILAGEPEGDDDRVSRLIWRQLQFEAISLTLVDHARKRDKGLGQRKLVAGDPFDLVPFGPPGDDEPEIPAGRGPIDLVDDAVAKCRPHATGSECVRHFPPRNLQPIRPALIDARLSAAARGCAGAVGDLDDPRAIGLPGR